MAYSRDDVQPPYAGGLTPGRRLTPRDFEVLDYNESILTPLETISNRKVTESSSIIQLARERLRRSFDETRGVDRADSIITLAAGYRLGPVSARRTLYNGRAEKRRRQGLTS